MKTTATAAMETVLNVPPLDIVMKAKAFATVDRLVQSGMWTPYFRAGHGKIGRIVSDPIFDMPRDRTTPVIDFTRRFDAVFPSREDWLSNWPTDLPSDCLVRFPDG